MSYHSQNVNILLDKDAPLWKKIEARAAKDGISVENLITVALNLNVGVAIKEYLNGLERMEAYKK